MSTAAVVGGSALGAVGLAKVGGARGMALGAVGGLAIAAGIGAAIHGFLTLRNDDSVRKEVDRIFTGYDNDQDDVLRSDHLDSHRSGWEHIGEGLVVRRQVVDGDELIDVPPGGDRSIEEYAAHTRDRVVQYSIADAFRDHGTAKGDAFELSRSQVLDLAVEHAGTDGRFNENELTEFRASFGERTVEYGTTPGEWARGILGNDRNEDGVITSQSPQEHPRREHDEATFFGTNGSSNHPMMVAADTDEPVNGVTTVDLEELTAYATRFDANHDGVLADSEVTAIREATPPIQMYRPGT